ncbi:Zinc finger protein 600 [Amphibalanus amphitrite]|uniref:Zinc finger protein 600 n=1 Tax=Amphibalanus amphitrite TaxID=1232801 RepID=A0A6A4X6D7_AMPAM|nr:Zinc finger protein 600 [Amphibalanus amphitrite]
MLGPTGGGGYPCQLCGETFRTQSKLSHHRAWHRGETICHVCQRVFARTDILRNHLRTAHDSSHLLRCDQCGLAFPSAPRLSEHRAWHRGETICHVCGRVFSRIDHMRRHMRTRHQVVLPSRR